MYLFAPPSFAVADVHANPRGVRVGGLYLHAKWLEMHGVTMVHLIHAGPRVSGEKVFGGPNWLDTDRFKIVAKAEGPVITKTFQPMLQALLEDGFQLEVRHEDKPEQV